MKKIILVLLVVTIPFVLGSCDRSAPVLKGIDKTVEVQCGSDFNLDQYLNDNLKITDETDEGTVEYKLKDLEYEITCDETVYDADSGKVETGDYGTFDVEVIVKDEARNKAKLDFDLFLNPVTVEKGFYMYPDDVADGIFNAIGFCEIMNTSEQFLKISDIAMKFIDGQDVVLYEADMMQYASEYLESGRSCYVMDDFVGWDIELQHEDDIADIIVDFNYSRDKKENDNTLEVNDIKESLNHGKYAATAIVTNPYNKGVDYYEILAGMYDENGKLIGMMKSYGDTTSISSNGKGKATVTWGPDSTAIPDKTKEVRAQARVVSYEGEL